jgi:hypothetical protein
VSLELPLEGIGFPTEKEHHLLRDLVVVCHRDVAGARSKSTPEGVIEAWALARVELPALALA